MDTKRCAYQTTIVAVGCGAAVLAGCGGAPGEGGLAVDEQAVASQQYAVSLPWNYSRNAYRLRSTTNGQCIDVPGGTRSVSLVQGYPCHRGINQKWELRRYRSGSVVIRSQASGLCLDVPGGSHGTLAIQQYPCHGGINQRFRLRDRGRHLEIVAEHSLWCIRTVGSRLYQTRCNGEGFKLDTYLGHRRYLIENVESRGWLQVPYATSAPVQIEHRRPTPWSDLRNKWDVYWKNNFRYEFRNALTGQCLTRAERYGTVDYIVRQQPCLGTSNQSWLPVQRAAVAFELRNYYDYQGCIVSPGGKSHGWVRHDGNCFGNVPSPRRARWYLHGYTN